MYINEQEKKFAYEHLDKTVAKFTKTADEVGNRIPRITVHEGSYVYAETPYSAREAFLPGILSMMYLKTKYNKFKEIAEHCDFTGKTPSILQMSNGAYHNMLQYDHINLVYGDDYLFEALMKIDGNEIFFLQDAKQN